MRENLHSEWRTDQQSSALALPVVLYLHVYVVMNIV